MNSAPPVSRLWLYWFGRYADSYLRKHFHSVSVLRDALPSVPDGSRILVCMNHPSWWDPLVALALAQRYFPAHRHYAPMDAASLAKYRFFSRLGFFGIEADTYAGSSAFLRTGQAILSQQQSALWVTAQGRFQDVRERPVRLQPGIGHLARLVPGIVVLPLALEYAFWDERKPEACAAFGPAIPVSGHEGLRPAEWTEQFSSSVETVQDRLSLAVRTRAANQFHPVWTSRSGVGGAYDVWRRCSARLRGDHFQPEHGSHS